MSKHDQLLSLYTGILTSLDLAVAENGELSLCPPGARDAKGDPLIIPAIVDGKRWVLPTKVVLSQSPWDDHIAFHPLSENIINGNSATINKVKAVINYKLNQVLGHVLNRMTEFAADTEHHGNVGAKASKYLKLVPNIRTPAAKHMANIVARTEVETSQRRLVNVFLNRSPQLDGRRYLRAAMVNFPFREELNGAEPKVFGVTISKKDQESFKALFDFILPDNESLSTYSHGTDSHTAPTFEALMKAYLKIADRLNEVILTHKKLFVGAEELVIDTSWSELFAQIDTLAAAIPPLPGNVGEPMRGSTAAKQPPAPTPAARKRATQLFDEKLKPVEKKAERPLVAPTEETDDEGVHVSRPVPPKTLSFSERVAQQRNSVGPRFGQREPARGGSSFDRSLAGRDYRNTREDPVPAWAENPTGTRTIAGVDPAQQRQLDLQRSSGRFVGGSTRQSFSERMAQRGFGGEFSPRGDRFRL